MGNEKRGKEIEKEKETKDRVKEWIQIEDV
jgi:hypothetical protein